MSPRAKKVESPEIVAARAKLEDAGEIVGRAIEGGLLADLTTGTGWRSRWGNFQHAKSSEAARRFRALVEGLGVRVFCEPRKKAYNGITMTIDAPGGRLVCLPMGGGARFQEG